MVAISIRPLSAEDAREFLAVVLDSEQELLPWVTTPLRVRSLADANREVSIILPEPLNGPARYGAFIERDLVGSGKLMLVDRDQLKVEVGVWIAPRARRQRVGVRLVKGCVHAAFDGGALEVVLRCSPLNIPSRKMLESAGGVLAGPSGQRSLVGGSRGESLVFRFSQNIGRDGA